MGEGREEFGVAGVFEAGVVKRRLADWVGDDSRGLARLGQSGGLLDGRHGCRRVGGIGLSGDCRRGKADRQHRQRSAEHAGRFGGGGDFDAAGIEHRVAEHDEGVRFTSRGPGGERDFRTDPGRVAHGECEGFGRHERRVPIPKELHQP